MFSSNQLFEQLQALPKSHHYWLAFSGGLDSLVLVHSFVKLRKKLDGIKLTAIHVHHGLHPDADCWAAHCQTICDQLEVELNIEKVNVDKKTGDSLEDAARKARYSCFSHFLQPGDALVTAHHRFDQAETLLLQLMRGCGPRGLAAMPKSAQFGVGQHLRPLLAFSQKQLTEYAIKHGLEWVEDSSNAETNFNRNFLRHEILPQLLKRWPGVDKTIARTAQHCATSLHLTDALAEMDLHQCKGDNNFEKLNINRLVKLSDERIANLLRYWLLQLNLTIPNTKRLRQIFQSVLAAKSDRQPLIKWQGGEIRRYRNYLYAMPNLATMTMAKVPWNLGQPLALNNINITLSTETATGRGLKQSMAMNKSISVGFRQGGEVCQIHPNPIHKRLKKLFQEKHIPPWQRDRLPLIFVGQNLAAVADLWVCEPYAAHHEESGLRICLRNQI